MFLVHLLLSVLIQLNIAIIIVQNLIGCNYKNNYFRNQQMVDPVNRAV